MLFVELSNSLRHFREELIAMAAQHPTGPLIALHCGVAPHQLGENRTHAALIAASDFMGPNI